MQFEYKPMCALSGIHTGWCFLNFVDLWFGIINFGKYSVTITFNFSFTLIVQQEARRTNLCTGGFLSLAGDQGLLGGRLAAGRDHGRPWEVDASALTTGGQLLH